MVEPPTSGGFKTTETTTTFIDTTGPTADRRPSVISLATAEPEGSPVTPLASRIFGTWNTAVGVVRLFAAFHIHEPAWYQLQMLVNVLGLIHFNLEIFVYKTAKPTGPPLVPMTVATIGLVWSLAQYSHYVR